MQTLQEQIDAAATELLSESGRLPTLVTAHPDTIGIEAVAGYTIKLDPNWPPGKVDIS